MSPDVFICHSANDSSLAEIVRSALEAHKISCVVSSPTALADSGAGEALLNGVETWSVMVLVFSASSNESESVRREVGHAIKAEKVIIPFRIENVAPVGALEAYFRQRYFHDALTPPLEKHLEELAKMLKPLVHQRKNIMADSASISRTLPSRASVLRKVDAGTEASADSSYGPLKLWFQLNRVLSAGTISSCECRIKNSGIVSLEKVEFIVDGRGIKQSAKHTLAELESGGIKQFLIELEPIRSGKLNLDVTVNWRQSGRLTSLTGTINLTVVEARSNADLMRRSQSIPMKFGIDTGINKSSGDTAATAPIPEVFEMIEMKLDYVVATNALDFVGHHRRLEIPQEFLQSGQVGTQLKLEALQAVEDMPFQDIRLIARNTFGLGRSRDESDFLLWFWPRNEIHDTKTRRISKKHCTLTAEKGKLQVMNSAAASLTTFDGQDLAGPDGLFLEQRGTLNLSGIYALQMVRFPGTSSHGPEIANLSAWNRGGLTNTGLSASGSVRFTSLTPNTMPQNSAWILTDATMGTSRINPIVLNMEGMAEIQSRFHYYLGMFWLENFVPNDALKIDGHVPQLGSIIPLSSGQIIQLGQKNFYLTITP